MVNLKANQKLTFFDTYTSNLKLYPKIMFISIFLTLAYVSLRMCLNYQKAVAGEQIPEKKPLTIIEFLVDMYHDRYVGEISEKITNKAK